MRLSGLGGSFVNDFCCGARAGGEGQDSAEGLPHVPSILNVGSLHDLSREAGFCVCYLCFYAHPHPPSTLVQAALRSVGPEWLRHITKLDWR